jgi:hypothetical protein
VRYVLQSDGAVTKAASLLLALCVLPVAVTGQTLEAGELRLKLGGRMQAQWSTTSVDEAELIAQNRRPAAAIPSSMFETRRVRLATELAYGDLVTGKIELEFGMARLLLRDVWMNLAIDPAVQLRFGQFKKPFSLMQLTSSSRGPIIERSVRIRGLTDRLLADDQDSVIHTFRGRLVPGEEHELLDVFGYQNFDLGAMVHGAIGRFGYQVGVFNGPGSDANDDTNGKSIAGRATFKVLTSTPLTVGAGISTREHRVTSTPTILTLDGTAYELDFELGDFRRKGIHLLGEATTGTNLVTEKSFLGAHLIAAWFQPVEEARIEGWEIAGRVSWADPDDAAEGDEGMLLTPGFNVYFSGRNRLMLNWDVYLPGGANFHKEHALRAQAQVYF